MSARSLSTRLTALGCVVLAASLLVPPSAAADPAPPPRPSITDTGKALVVRHAAAFTETRAAQPQSPPSGGSTKLESGSFFKSGPGIAVLAAFGAGVGYALYSASNDRIKSPGR